MEPQGIESRTPASLASSSNYCTNVHFYETTASVVTLPHIQWEKILKHVLNKEPERKESPEERDKVVMTLLA